MHKKIPGPQQAKVRRCRFSSSADTASPSSTKAKRFHVIKGGSAALPGWSAHRAFPSIRTVATPAAFVPGCSGVSWAVLHRTSLLRPFRAARDCLWGVFIGQPTSAVKPFLCPRLTRAKRAVAKLEEAGPARPCPPAPRLGVQAPATPYFFASLIFSTFTSKKRDLPASGWLKSSTTVWSLISATRRLTVLPAASLA